MAIFRRNNNDSVLPEVDQYYEAERRDRSGLAWLLALVSVAVVAMLIIGLFMGGRWAYNKLANNDDNKQTAQNDDNNNLPSFDGSEKEENTDNERSAENADGTAEDNESTPDTSNEDEAEEEEEPARETPRTPVTGDSDDLPNTGPSNLVGVFAAVSTVSGGVHYVIQRRKI